MISYFDIFLVTAGVHLMYAQPLHTVAGKLTELATNVHHDRGFQDNIIRLAGDAQQAANSFQMIEADGSEILAEKNRLVNKASDRRDVNVDTLRKKLKTAGDSVTTEQEELSNLEEGLSSIIESCNGRIDHVTSRITTLDQLLGTISIEIATLENNISSIDQSIDDLEQSARHLDKDADDLRIQTSHDVFFYVSLLILVVVALYAGASLAMVCAATEILHHANLNDVQACNRNAQLSRDLAMSKRQERRAQRSKLDTLVAERQALESEMRTLRTSSDELQQTVDGLHDVGRDLRLSHDVINDLQQAVSNVDTAMEDAECSTFQILQNWVAARIPEDVGANIRSYFDTLNETWACLEIVLVQNKTSLT